MVEVDVLVILTVVVLELVADIDEVLVGGICMVLVEVVVVELVDVNV